MTFFVKTLYLQCIINNNLNDLVMKDFNFIGFMFFLVLTLFSLGGEVPTTGDFAGCALCSDVNWVSVLIFSAITTFFGIKTFGK